MTKILTSLFFALICCTATICNATELSTIKETVEYNSADDAARAALTEIFDSVTTNSNEMAGVIVQIGSKFFYTEPVGSSEYGHFNVRASYPKNAKVVAIYHDHPGIEKLAEFFSIDDVNVAMELNLVSYIGIVDSHNIRRFTPGKSARISASGSLTSAKYSAGSVI
jgi:hypothetical protein